MYLDNEHELVHNCNVRYMISYITPHLFRVNYIFMKIKLNFNNKFTYEVRKHYKF